VGDDEVDGGRGRGDEHAREAHGEKLGKADARPRLLRYARRHHVRRSSCAPPNVEQHCTLAVCGVSCGVRCVPMRVPLPPRHTPKATAQTSGWSGRPRPLCESSTTTGTMVVVNGMLSMNAETSAHTHISSTMAKHRRRRPCSRLGTESGLSRAERVSCRVRVRVCVVLCRVVLCCMRTSGKMDTMSAVMWAKKSITPISSRQRMSTKRPAKKNRVPISTLARMGSSSFASMIVCIDTRTRTRDTTRHDTQ